MGQRFVLLDRDGTVLAYRPYLANPEEVELAPGAGEALRQLSSLGLGLIVITNQSAIGRGYFDETRLRRIHDRLIELLAEEGVRLDGIYACPHHPDDCCRCRKPNQGLVDQAALRHGFNPAESFVVGDADCDVELGHRIGAVTLLVRRENSVVNIRPDHVVRDLHGAAEVIRDLVAGRTVAP